jgi:hypothetical protein
MNERRMNVLASIGLAVGGILGMAGTFAPTAALRSLAWGIDGIALIMATALLTLLFFRRGEDIVAAGFLVFAIGESLIVATAAMDPSAAVPIFGVGTGLWAMALALISVPRVLPLGVRLLGLVAAVLFSVTALQILAGAVLTPTTAPLPFNAYPVLVATMGGWIWTLLRPTREPEHTSATS